MSLLGLALAHLLGSLLRTGLSGLPLASSLRSPSSAWFALAGLYALSLGQPGLAVASAVVLGCLLLRTPEPRAAVPWWPLAGVAVLVLARPWVPTGWDEFVWLGKARFEAQGFGAGVAAALDPGLRVIPPGYPPLWPLAVGWLSLGRDSLDTHVLSGSLLLLLTLASALEAWSERLGRPDLVTLGVLATPLVWVHLRSTYLDLPVGLLAAAFLGQLVRRGAAAVPMAVVLVAFKDEGLAHVLAGALAAALVARESRWRPLVPAAAGAVAALTWKWLCARHGVSSPDHALGMPTWPWVPTLLTLAASHATDVVTWGVFWPVLAVAALRARPADEGTRAARLMLALGLLFTAGAVLAGPERVRVFAENGSLLNRLLLQLWPVAALVVLARQRWAPAPTVAPPVGVDDVHSQVLAEARSN